MSTRAPQISGFSFFMDGSNFFTGSRSFALWLFFPFFGFLFPCDEIQFALVFFAAAPSFSSLASCNSGQGNGAAKFLSLLVLVLGVLTLLEYSMQLNWELDEWFVRDFFADTAHFVPGRMSPNAAFSLRFSGSAFSFESSSCRRASASPYSLIFGITFVVFLISLFALVGHLMA